MDLQHFFQPRAVAVIGASSDPGKVGHAVLRNLAGYQGGPVYAVNPSADEILGHPAYPSLEELPEVPELIVVCIPAEAVPPLVRSAGRMGVKAAVVISAGFEERGEEGIRLARELAAAGRMASVEIVGPNALGIIDAHNGLNASIAPAMPLPGEVAVLSQSGALCTGLLDMYTARCVGISKLISMGNKADLDETDHLEALASDPRTEVIACYLEGIEEGARFIRHAARIARSKPIVVVKAGNTAGGARAASAHTGSQASSEQAYDCAFRIAGIIRASGFEELVDLTQGLAWQPLPRGERVVVLTNAGGAGTLGADAVEERGLQLAELSEETRAALVEALPAAARARNPVDLLGDADADRYQRVLDIVTGDPNVDAVLVIHSPQISASVSGIATALAERGTELKLPLLVNFLGAGAVAEGAAILQQRRVPCYPSPERAVRTLKVMVDHRRWLDSPERSIRRIPVNTNKVRKIIKNHRRRGLARFGEQDAKAVLEAYGIEVPRSILAGSAEQAIAAANKLGYPVVMKVVSQDVTNKSEVGGVRMGLMDADRSRTPTI